LNNQKQKTMAEFELKNGTGTIFKNEKNTSDKSPNYQGEIKTPSGENLKLSLWVKQAKSGKMFFSVNVQEVIPKQATTSIQLNEFVSNDLPF